MRERDANDVFVFDGGWRYVREGQREEIMSKKVVVARGGIIWRVLWRNREALRGARKTLFFFFFFFSVLGCFAGKRRHNLFAAQWSRQMQVVSCFSDMKIELLHFLNK
ncbi:hypothetical protein LR48_Vigan03g308400 [Vigna angularis]|uniref:Transmembrane protein n=1 Tax=Phaseolus angularis TaxID=3914 RepID=A0A0L9UAW6_PHAAN|nr:hypothetical protein LR48_Vigan03g308400 [Vigna angularis]